MSVAVSLPGLVSQRQCKVTARPTRASRYRHVCNGPQPPFPAQRPAPHPPRPRPISAVCQYVSPSSPMQCPQWPRQHSDALHIFCAARLLLSQRTPPLPLPRIVLHTAARKRTTIRTASAIARYNDSLEKV